jgi:hypothetical protein
MDYLYKDNVETLQNNIPCFVWAKHIIQGARRAPQKGSELRDIRPLKAKYPALKRF